MSHVSSDHPQESGMTPAASSERSNRLSRPGWPEIIVGLVVMGAVSVGVAILARWLGPATFGLVLTALSGVAGMG